MKKQQTKTGKKSICKKINSSQKIVNKYKSQAAKELAKLRSDNDELRKLIDERKGKNETRNIDENFTGKELLFCQEYLVDLNATEAAIRSGYSKKSAREIGSQNLTKLHIQKKIAECMKARSESIEVTAEMVVRELASIAFTNIKEFISFDDEGNIRLRDSEELDSNKTKSISSIDLSFTKAGTRKTKFKLYDKVEALKLLAQHLGMLKTDILSGGKPLGGKVDLSKLNQDELLLLYSLTSKINQE